MSATPTRRRLTALAVLALTLVGAACLGDDGADGASATTPSSTAYSTSTSAPRTTTTTAP